jgi:hypothetical protein
VRGRQEIAKGNLEYLAQSDEVFRRDALRRALIGFDLSGLDAQLPGEKVLAEPQGAAFAPEAPADVPIIRRHNRRSSETLYRCY